MTLLLSVASFLTVYIWHEIVTADGVTHKIVYCCSLFTVTRNLSCCFATFLLEIQTH